MTTLLLVRHGETEWNREGRLQGQADPPLTDGGRGQAQRLGTSLALSRLDAIYSSNLARASETAELVAKNLGLSVSLHPGLREIDHGEWSGLTTDEIRERYPDGYARWSTREAHGWTGGESYDDMGRRVVSALHEIASSHRGRRVLVVTHGGPIRAAQACAAGTPYAFVRRDFAAAGHCAIATFYFDGGRLRSAQELASFANRCTKPS